MTFTLSDFPTSLSSNDPPKSNSTKKGRASSATQVPPTVIVSDHAPLFSMDSETPSSTSSSNLATGPLPKPTGTKAKKKIQSQKPQTNIQQILAPPATQKVIDGLRQVLDTLPPLASIPPPTGITLAASLMKKKTLLWIHLKRTSAQEHHQTLLMMIHIHLKDKELSFLTH